MSVGVQYVPVVPLAQPDPGSGLAIAGMILGIIGLVFFWFPACLVGWPCALIGLVLSAVGMRSRTRRGLAIAGLVCSIAAFGLWIAVFVIIPIIVHS
jgi:hypothetical protein